MATAFKSFRFPLGYPNFIPYNGPPPPKPKPTQRRIRKATPPDLDEWPDIDQILGPIAESRAGPEDRGRLTPTIRTAQSQGLLYLGDCVSSKGLPSYQSDQQKKEDEEAFWGPNIERRDASLDYLFEGSCPEDPIVIKDDPNDTCSSKANIKSDSGQPEHRINGLNRIINSQAPSVEGQGIWAAVTQQFTSLGNKEGMNYGNDMLEFEENPSGNLSSTGEPSFTQGKRKRSRSADTNGSTAEILDLTLEQPLMNSYLAKRQRSHSPPGNHPASNRISQPKLASPQAHNIATPNIRDADDKHSSNADDNDINILASGRSDVSDKEGSSHHERHGHTHDRLTEPTMRLTSPSRQSHSCRDGSEDLYRVDDPEKEDAGYDSAGDGAGDKDNDIDPGSLLLVGRVAPAQQLKSSNPYLLKRNVRMPRNGTSRHGLAAHGDAERRQRKVRSKQRQNLSSPGAGGPKAKLANKRASPFTVESRRERLSKSSYRRIGRNVSAGSDNDAAGPSPALPVLPSLGSTRVRSNLSSVGGSSHAPHKLLNITLHPVSEGTTFLAAVIQADGNKLAFPYSEPAELVESTLGQVGTIDEVTIKVLSPDWLLFTGLLRSLRGTTGLSVSRSAMPASGISPRYSQDHGRIIHHGIIDAEAAALEDDERSSDSDLDPSDVDGDMSDDDKCPSARKRNPWPELDEQRLLAYRKEDKPWEWIFRQFPHRTRGAVRTRWHMLQGRRGKAEETSITDREVGEERAELLD